MNEIITIKSTDWRDKYQASNVSILEKNNITQTIVKKIKEEIKKEGNINFHEKTLFFLQENLPSYNTKHFAEILYHLIDEDIKGFEEIQSRGDFGEIANEGLNQTILETMSEVLKIYYLKIKKHNTLKTSIQKNLLLSLRQ